MLFAGTKSCFSVQRNNHCTQLSFTPESDGLTSTLCIGSLVFLAGLMAAFPSLRQNTFAIISASSVICGLLFFTWLNAGKRYTLRITQQHVLFGRQSIHTSSVSEVKMIPVKNILLNNSFRKIMGWHTANFFSIAIKQEEKLHILPLMLEATSAQMAVAILQKQLQATTSKDTKVMNTKQAAPVLTRPIKNTLQPALA